MTDQPTPRRRIPFDDWLPEQQAAYLAALEALFEQGQAMLRAAENDEPLEEDHR